jgi:chorismate mutase / prephenate dehydratase
MMRRESILTTTILPGVAAATEQGSVAKKLAECRSSIDETDQQIVKLLNQRAKIVADIGEIKQEAHLPVTVPAREKQVLDRVVQMGSGGPLPPDVLRHIYETIVREMRTWEEALSK